MEELIEKLKARGADMKGAKERFLGDEDLYEICFKAFLEDEAFDNLKKAIEAQNYKEASDCAHTLKGVAGNLGLTDMFDATSNLLNPLRNEDYTNLDKLTKNVFQLKSQLESLINSCQK